MLSEITVTMLLQSYLRALPIFGIAKFITHNLITGDAPIISPTQVIEQDRMDARLAEDVYRPFDGSKGAGPWHKQRADFTREISGFHARLYHASLGSGSYVLAYEGTDPTSPGDWIANLMQGTFGPLTTQYWDAYEVAEASKKIAKRDNASFEITGHSLGGGLASAAALATNSHAVTFNSAGLHPLTQWIFGGFGANSATVVAYHVEGEFLTKLQSNTSVFSAYGTTFYTLKPAPQDENADMFALHGMDVVKRAMGAL